MEKYMLPVMNAAGMVKHVTDIRPLLRLPSEYLYAITLGSYTPEARAGNSGRTYAPPLNALGMPNPGIDALKSILEEISEDPQSSSKVFRVSIAGFAVDDYAEMAEKVSKMPLARVLELNLGCPNVRDSGKQKPIASFDLKSIEEILDAVHEYQQGYFNILDIVAKLSPYSDPGLYGEVLALLSSKHTKLQGVVLTNTFANAYGFDETGQPLITANEGFGGLSGDAMKNIALGHVRQARKVLPGFIRVVGVGGIETPQDVLNMERVGADAIQIGNAFFKTMDPRFFQNLAYQYTQEITS